MIESEGKSLVECLEALGIEKHDIVMLHSDVSRLMKLPLDASKPLRLLLDALLTALSSGVLLVPTFTYRFCRTLSYDSQKMRSEVGYFTEYVRCDTRAIRSQHPIFSVAAIGVDAPFLCRNLSNSSFGPGSVFERLHVSGAKILTFDVTLAASCTFAHFSEQKVGVTYRYSKYFRGNAIIDGEPSLRDWEFYVRNTESWDFPPQPPGEMSYTEELFATDRARLASWHGLPITVAACTDILDVIGNGIRRNPYYLLPGSPTRKRRPG